MSLGQPERQTHDYIRHGTTDLFAALDAATGEVLGKCYTRHRAIEFKKFLVEIEAAVPRELNIHVVALLAKRYPQLDVQVLNGGVPDMGLTRS